MKQNKKIKILQRIFALALSLIAVLSCIVIAPSADSYTENCTHFWFYFDSSVGVTVPADGVAMFKIEVRSGRRSRIAYIYDRVGGNNQFDFWFPEEYDILFSLVKGANSDGTSYLESRCEIRDVGEEYGPIDGPRITITKYYNSNGECQRMNIQTYRMEHDVYLDWEPSYGTYNLQIWLDLNSIQNIVSQLTIPSHYAKLADVVQASCRYNLISKPKQYSEGVEVGFEQGYNKGYDEGYVEGSDFGYEQGYGDGHDAGEINGIQIGKEEGYRVGYEEGYGIGFSDGNDEGYELGKDVGYENGYDDAKAVYDTGEAWQDMKSLIFAIFDAPFYVISYSLDFDIFGINIAGTLIALISTALIVWILKIIIVKLF